MSQPQLYDVYFTGKLLDDISPDKAQASVAALFKTTPEKIAHLFNGKTHVLKRKLSKEDAQINWAASAKDTVLKVNAFNPFPVAWFKHNDQAVRVHAASALPSNGDAQGEVISFDKDGLVVATGSGALLITKLQLPGKKAMNVKDLINGSPNAFLKGQQLV